MILIQMLLIFVFNIGFFYTLPLEVHFLRKNKSVKAIAIRLLSELLGILVIFLTVTLLAQGYITSLIPFILGVLIGLFIEGKNLK